MDGWISPTQTSTARASNLYKYSIHPSMDPSIRQSVSGWDRRMTDETRSGSIMPGVHLLVHTSHTHQSINQPIHQLPYVPLAGHAMGGRLSRQNTSIHPTDQPHPTDTHPSIHSQASNQQAARQPGSSKTRK
mmetsp:Transcript_42820/g.107008  ORF Transcript_42820/g.107008 Transcript_42820/m.107008 type:complete len:132 (-) Transcript_42820:624-1019(-)